MLIDKTLETKVSGPSDDHSPYTDYWAAEDPMWIGRGFDDPETLSRVQMMVYEDPWRYRTFARIFAAKCLLTWTSSTRLIRARNRSQVGPSRRSVRT